MKPKLVGQSEQIKGTAAAEREKGVTKYREATEAHTNKHAETPARIERHGKGEGGKNVI